jgi:hypothetical protein
MKNAALLKKQAEAEADRIMVSKTFREIFVESYQIGYRDAERDFHKPKVNPVIGQILAAHNIGGCSNE